MKLKGSNLLYVKARMKRAEEMGSEEMPVRVRLSLSSGTNFDYVKSDLGNYQAKIVPTSVGEKIDLYTTKETLTMIEVPSKNLRKVIEQKYVRGYEWPGIVEELSESKPKMPSLGFLTGPKASDEITILNEPKPKPGEITDLTEEKRMGRGFSGQHL